MQGGLTGISKCLELQNLIIREKLDILCLNETNLKSDIDTNSLDLPKNFTFLRKDRPTDNGHGGCGILVSTNINYELIVFRNLTFPTDKIEALWIHLNPIYIYVAFIDLIISVQ